MQSPRDFCSRNASNLWGGKESEMDLTQMPTKVSTKTETCSHFGHQIPVSVSMVACKYANTIQNYSVQLTTRPNTQAEVLFYM